ncbi:MAG: hypothetical protein ACI8RH_000662, partial [Flavobacteriales bacterium]
SGINLSNVLAFKEAGFKMIHFSAISKGMPAEKATTGLFLEGIEGTSDQDVISEIIDTLKRNS